MAGQCPVKMGFFRSNAWMTGHFVLSFMLLKKKLIRNFLNEVEPELLMLVKEKKKKTTREKKETTRPRTCIIIHWRHLNSVLIGYKHTANSCWLCFHYVIPKDNSLYTCRSDVIPTENSVYEYRSDVTKYANQQFEQHCHGGVKVCHVDKGRFGPPS